MVCNVAHGLQAAAAADDDDDDDDDSDGELSECKMTCLCRRRRFVVTRVSL